MQTPQGPRRPSRSRLSLLLSADAAPSHFQNHNYAHDLPDPSFRFTPRATTLHRAPRLWDRKPRPPANPFSRNRQVWKRVLDGSARGDHGHDDDNNSEGAKGAGSAGGGVAVKRGVKRLKVGTHVSQEGEHDDEVPRVFVETKWVDMAQLEAKRKYPRFPHDNHETSCHEETETNPDRTSETQNAATQVESLVARQASIDDSDKDRIMSITIPPPDAPPPQAEGEPCDDDDKAPRLRYSLLEEDVAEVLSDFLSRAKAKRAAANSPMEDVTASDNSNNDHSKKSEGSPVETGTPGRRALAELDANSSSPVRQKFAASVGRENSVTAAKPSANTELHSQQQQQEEEEEDVERKELAPTAGVGAGDEAEEEAPGAGTPEPEAQTEEVDLGYTRNQQGSPRRRNNKKAGVVSTTARRKGKSAPRVPNTINLRRATGAEFVFKQRSDAQQLALTTKANMKKNKGDAKLPHLALPALRRQQQEQQATEAVAETGKEKETDKDKDTETGVGARKRPRSEQKRVTFDEDNLVSYCDGDEGAKGLLSLEDVGLATPARSKKATTTASTATTGSSSAAATPAGPAPAPATATASGEEEKAPLAQFSPSVPRKVRRLGPVKRSGQHPTQAQAQNQTQTQDRTTDPTNPPDEGDDEKGKQTGREGRTKVPRVDTPKPKRTRNAIPRAVVTRQTDTEKPLATEKKKEKEETGRGARRVAAGWSRAAARRRGGPAVGERIKS